MLGCDGREVTGGGIKTGLQGRAVRRALQAGNRNPAVPVSFEVTD